VDALTRWGELIPHDEVAGESCLCGCNDQPREVEATLTLLSRDLLSKWGFNDGNDPDEWLDYCEANGLDLDFPLEEVVRRYLAPRLEQDVTVVHIETCHNPIRAETVNGLDVTEVWFGRATGPTLTPECVDVPLSEALKIAQEVAA
jgi:hypothetical protein